LARRSRWSSSSSSSSWVSSWWASTLGGSGPSKGGCQSHPKSFSCVGGVCGRGWSSGGRSNWSSWSQRCSESGSNNGNRGHSCCAHRSLRCRWVRIKRGTVLLCGSNEWGPRFFLSVWASRAAWVDNCWCVACFLVLGLVFAVFGSFRLGCFVRGLFVLYFGYVGLVDYSFDCS